MHDNKFLHFITEKIEDLGGAIFYCYSTNPLRINNTIIQSSKVDSCGSIYFFIKRPTQLVSEFEQEFPVGLNYFKKGKNYFLNVFGKARIINDPDVLAYQTDLTEEEINSAMTTHILIKVHIININYHDSDYERKSFFFKGISSVVSKIFAFAGAASSKSYGFHPRASLQNYSF